MSGSILSDDEYNAKLKLAGELCALDPDPDSEKGRELLVLVEELQEYEREKFPDLFVRELIADLRGGVPPRCSFCGQDTPPDKLDPEEGGDWACHECQERWAKEDGGVRKY